MSLQQWDLEDASLGEFGLWGIETLFITKIFWEQRRILSVCYLHKSVAFIKRQTNIYIYLIYIFYVIKMNWNVITMDGNSATWFNLYYIKLAGHSVLFEVKYNPVTGDSEF